MKAVFAILGLIGSVIAIIQFSGYSTVYDLFSSHSNPVAGSATEKRSARSAPQEPSPDVPYCVKFNGRTICE
jgi:hypothetical protein